MKRYWLIFLLLGLASCGTPTPSVDSVADSIAVAAASIETAAQTTAQLCRHERPGGPCAPDAAIDSTTRDRIKRGLQDALDYVALARVALVGGDETLARDRLSRASLLLTLVRDELREAQP